MSTRDDKPGNDSDRRATGGPGHFRDSVRPAEPPPVTDAMISPRSSDREAQSGGGPQCHVCGASNRPNADYCLQCGSRLRPDADADAGDHEEFSLHAPVSPQVTEDADESWFDPEWDEEPWEDPEPRVEAPQEQEDQPESRPRRDPTETARYIGGGILALIVLLIVVATFLRDDDETAATTTTTLATGVEVELYGSLISELAADTAELSERAATVNQRWEDGDADFQETLDGLEQIETDTNEVGSRLRLQEPPPEIGTENHVRLEASIGTLERAATGMVNGLQAPDSGEARRAELSRYQAAATEFQARVDNILQLIDMTGSG